MFDRTTDSMSNAINRIMPIAMSKYFIVFDNGLPFVPPVLLGGGTNFFRFLVFLLLVLFGFIPQLVIVDYSSSSSAFLIAEKMV